MKNQLLATLLGGGMCICPPALFVAAKHLHHKHHPKPKAVVTEVRHVEPYKADKLCLPTADALTPPIGVDTALAFLPPSPTPTSLYPAAPPHPTHGVAEPSTLADVAFGGVLGLAFVTLRRRSA